MIPEKKKDDFSHSQWLSHQPRPVQLAVHWIEKNRRLLLFGTIAVVLIAVFGGGSVYYKQQRLMKAAALYADLLPDTDKAQRRAALENIAQKYPNTGAGIAARFHLGREAFEEKKYSEAVAWFEKIKGLSAKQAMIRILAQHNLAAVYEAQGEWQRALEIYRKTVADPANQSVVISYYHMGRALEALGRSDEARKWFEKTIEKGIGLEIAGRAKEHLLWLDISKSS